jgi:hypothetical protein
MPTEIATLLPVLSIVVSLCLVIGGFFAFRTGYNKTASEIQEKVIEALKAQNEAQEVQIKTCEKEISRLKRVVATIQYALKRRGLRIEIDGDTITLIDDQSRNTRTVQISLTDKQIDEEERQTT